MFENREVLWVVHIGNDDRIALRARDEGFVCIGWTSWGDLSAYDTREKLKAMIEERKPGMKPGRLANWAGQIYRFVHVMRVGDPIVFPVSPTREIAIGRIAGPYRFATDDSDLAENDYCNIRKVEWLKIVPRTAFSQAALHSFGAFSTISTSSDHLDEVLEVLEVLAGETRIAPKASAEKASAAEALESPDEDEAAGPDLLAAAVQETEDYLLKSWYRTGAEFERVVAAVLEAIGYTATVTPPSGDHGVDVIAHPDPLGLEQPFIKVQVKSGTSSVGEPEVSQLLGTLSEGEKGIVVSLGGYSSQALARARHSAKISLIGPQEFVALFLDHYDRLEAAWRARYPLQRVWVPTKR